MNDASPSHLRDAITSASSLPAPAVLRRRSMVLITGGCGFVGANLADRLASAGERVLLYDNLSRANVIKNLEWLQQRHGRRVETVANLNRVQVFCEGRLVADHARVWARHQTLSDPAHVAAAKALRRERIGLLRPAPEPEVEQRRLSDYDDALGIITNDTDEHNGGVEADGTVA